ncbi:phospholipase B1, membrane-associated-like [Saccoglossus kowalevskii]|uniref:Phospholipase B1, membrane-associated-like n=1 Tax=Saccoglossus kowalevskii TaxID=10224 RepID=A0ABM0MKE3_SACKO|nr:PREDICTED: phospholipase B1, membrane-associated-like [Saccoglossus kowalevskii]
MKTTIATVLFLAVFTGISDASGHWSDFVKAIYKASHYQEQSDLYESSNNGTLLPIPLPIEFPDGSCTSVISPPEFPDLPRPPRDFPCSCVNPGTSAVSVHALSPFDVKIVGALGDSLTAGSGADAAIIVGSLNDYRGVVYSIGGDEDFSAGVTTLPNILQEYSPSLKGFSLGVCNRDETASALNVASPGDVSRDMKYQAYRLIDRMKLHPDVDYELDWKVVTILIGGNDLCSFCDDKELYTAERYQQHLQEALDVLHEGMPRAFINLVSVLQVAELSQLNGTICNIIHCLFCTCVKYGDDQNELVELTKEYQRVTHELIDSGRYETSDDFTVVVQPFLEETTLPLDENGDPDKSYFAKDCFHFSEKGHATAAVNLWNNMFEPVGLKSRVFNPEADVYCPTQDVPYFYTSKNSGIEPTTSSSASPRISHVFYISSMVMLFEYSFWN